MQETPEGSIGVGKIPWSRRWQLPLVFLPGKFHRQRSPAGYSPWGGKEWDPTEHAHTVPKKATVSLNTRTSNSTLN